MLGLKIFVPVQTFRRTVGNLEVGNLEGIQGSRFYYKHVGRRDWHIRRWWVNTALERNLDRESAGGVWGRARPNTNTHRFIFQESLFLLAASTSAEETLQVPFLHCEIRWLQPPLWGLFINSIIIRSEGGLSKRRGRDGIDNGAHGNIAIMIFLHHMNWNMILINSF